MEAMTNEGEKVEGRFHRHVEMANSVDVSSGPQDVQRFDLKTAPSETRTFVSRDLLSQFEGRFVECMRGLENDLDFVKSELGKLSKFSDVAKENLGELKLNVNANKLGLEHVAKDVEVERFRSELENTRRELEVRVLEQLKDVEKDITNKFNEKTRTTLAALAAVSGIIAIIVSSLIQILT
jgi:hypothetical protein